MYSVSLMLTLACLWRIQTSECYRRDFHNVAYGKTVTLSSPFHAGGYDGSKAVNGMFTDLAHTGLERSPWLRIDLGGYYVVHEIEVFARAHCHKCGRQLHNFDVQVGKRTYDMRTCGHYSASAIAGERITVWCPGVTVGRYVQIQITRGDASYLSVAEVLVWGIRESLLKKYNYFSYNK